MFFSGCRLLTCFSPKIFELTVGLRNWTFEEGDEAACGMLAWLEFDSVTCASIFTHGAGLMVCSSAHYACTFMGLVDLAGHQTPIKSTQFDPTPHYKRQKPF